MLSLQMVGRTVFAETGHHRHECQMQAKLPGKKIKVLIPIQYRLGRQCGVVVKRAPSAPDFALGLPSLVIPTFHHGLSPPDPPS